MLNDEFVFYLNSVFGDFDILPFKTPFDVDDSPLILSVLSSKKVIQGLIHISHSSDNNQIHKAFTNSRVFHDSLSGDNKNVVLIPSFVGVLDGRSFSFTEYKKRLHEMPIWFFQRKYLEDKIAYWLINLAVKCNSKCDTVEAKANLLNLCVFFEGHPAVSVLINKSLEDLNSLKWKPLHVPDHNDFWKGNVLVDSLFSNDFFLIDWGAANYKGYGVHDMVTFCMSFKVSKTHAYRYFELYAKSLNLRLVDLISQFLLSMSYLLCNLNKFPVERFIIKFNNEFNYLKEVLCIS